MTRVLGVVVPLPTPGADDVTRKAHDLSDLIAGGGKALIVIIMCLIGAAVVMSLIRRPFVRGLLAGGALLAFVWLATK